MTVEFPRLLDCLASDFARLRAVAPIALDAVVPSCPDWTVADLTRHVGRVYQYVTLCIQEGAEPDPSPTDDVTLEEPLGLLDRGYRGLLDEFGRRDPGDKAGFWYKLDPTVGFWIRRMAQETVIHRVDAELGVGEPVATVPADLAVDGIDELLKIFVAYDVAEWGEYFSDILGDSPGWTYTVSTDGAAWRIRTGPEVFDVTDGAADTADMTVAGPPGALLRWLWNRGNPDGVTIEGEPRAIDEFRRCIVTATQ